MGKRILVILGHPTSNSFCGALAERYAQSAVRAGHEVRQLFLGAMDFDPVLRAMDTPPWYYRWVYRMPGLHQVRKTTLAFCGIEPQRTLTFGPTLGSSADQRETWLLQAQASRVRSQPRAEPIRLPAEQSLRAMRVSGQLNVEHRQLTGGRAL